MSAPLAMLIESDALKMNWGSSEARRAEARGLAERPRARVGFLGRGSQPCPSPPVRDLGELFQSGTRPAAERFSYISEAP